MQAQKFEKFIKLMMMTTSPSDGEALNACRMANGLLLEANLDWRDFLQGKAQIVSTPGLKGVQGKRYTNSDEINRMLDQVLSHTRGGTSFHNFIMSLNDWWKDNSYLTEKQYNALRKSYERI